jgi:flavin prenyltransferase
MRLIVGISGATGAPLGVAQLKALREMPDVSCSNKRAWPR